jgi:hypothetical protein
VMVADLRLESSIIDRLAARARDPHQVLSVCTQQRRRARVVAAMAATMVVAGGLWLALEGARGGAQAAAAAELPFDENARPTLLGEVTPGPAAARVERVVVLGLSPVNGALVADGHGGVVLRRGADPHRPRYPTSWTDDPLVLDVSPAPDGAVLATTRASLAGHLRVRQISPDGSSRVLLTDAREPMISPDGQRLAAVRRVEDRWQVAVASLSSLEAQRILTRGRGHTACPVWSPDGRRIAFLTRTVRDPVHYSRRYGHSHLWMVDAAGGEAHRLTGGVSLELSRPIWTTDGIWVLAREAASPGAVTVLWRVVPR